MIVLETNVISDALKPSPDPGVLTWLDGLSDPAITAIALGELDYGVQRLPGGQRRDGLAGLLETLIRDRLGNQVLDFDAAAARHYGDVTASCERMGHQMSVADGQIAAICRARSAPLATHNVRDFVDCGVELLNP